MMTLAFVFCLFATTLTIQHNSSTSYQPYHTLRQPYHCNWSNMASTGNGELASTFRAKAVFMKSWKPANSPSVCVVVRMMCFVKTSSFMFSLYCLFSATYLRICRTGIAWSYLRFISKQSVGMHQKHSSRRQVLQKKPVSSSRRQASFQKGV